MGRTSDAEEKLLDAALALVWANSVGGVTVEMICRSAGVRPGTFYHFFPSKNELIAKALARHWEERVAELDACFGPDLTPVQQLSAFSENCYRKALEQKKTGGRVLGSPFMAVGSELGDSDPHIAAVVKKVTAGYRKYMEKAIKAGMKSGDFHVCDAACAARLISTLGLGTMITARVHNEPRLLKGMAETVLHLLGYEEK